MRNKVELESLEDIISKAISYGLDIQSIKNNRVNADYMNLPPEYIHIFYINNCTVYIEKRTTGTMSLRIFSPYIEDTYFLGFEDFDSFSKSLFQFVKNNLEEVGAKNLEDLNEHLLNFFCNSDYLMKKEETLTIYRTKYLEVDAVKL